MALRTLLLLTCFVVIAGGYALIAGRFQRGLPYYLKLPDGEQHDLPQDSPKCSRYMEFCVPDQGGCCGELVCRNILRDFCLYPLEQCRCTKLRIYQDIRK